MNKIKKMIYDLPIIGKLYYRYEMWTINRDYGSPVVAKDSTKNMVSCDECSNPTFHKIKCSKNTK